MERESYEGNEWNDFHDDKRNRNMTLEWPDEYVIRFAKRWQKAKDIKKVLDMQCGAGRHTAYLAELGFNVTGCDVSDQALKAAKKLLDKRGYQAKLCCEDSLSLSFEDNCFDALVAWRSLHVFSMDNMPRAVMEMNRVVRPNGQILFSTRSDRNLLTAAAIEQEFQMPIYLTKEELTEIIKEYIEVEQIELNEFTSDNMQIRNSYWIVLGTPRK